MGAVSAFGGIIPIIDAAFKSAEIGGGDEISICLFSSLLIGVSFLVLILASSRIVTFGAVNARRVLIKNARSTVTTRGNDEHNETGSVDGDGNDEDTHDDNGDDEISDGDAEQDDEDELEWIDKAMQKMPQLDLPLLLRFPTTFVRVIARALRSAMRASISGLLFIVVLSVGAAGCINRMLLEQQCAANHVMKSILAFNIIFSYCYCK